jgi:GWxTD domain-containing protein
VPFIPFRALRIVLIHPAIAHPRAVKRRISTLLLGLLLFVLPVAAQDGGFDIDVVSVRGEHESRNARVDVYVRVAYPQLTFLNTPEGFAASYEVTAHAYRVDSRGRRQGLAQTRIWDRQVATPLFARTQSAGLVDRSNGSLDLPPGTYALDVRLRDPASQQIYRQEQVVEVRNLNRPVAVSDLILLEGHRASENQITPAASNRIGTEARGFTFFYEVYADAAQSVHVHRQVVRLNTGGQSLMRTIFRLGRDRDDDAGDVTFEHEEPLRLRTGRNQSVLDIPLADLRAGDYLVRLRVSDAAGRVLDTAERVVSVNWSGLDEHIRDLEEAIDQLQYIAKRNEIDHIKGGRTPAERLTRFQAFWDKRDPTPNTPRNERMEEYYYRIDYANRRFTSLRDGWRTDRGHVMVLFGEPDNVESHPFDFNVRPYEVWYYYRIGRRFVFIDRSNVGDYELMVPIWDERTRIR